MDTQLETAVNQGRFKEDEARQVQDGLVRTGMTLDEYDADPEEFEKRLLQNQKREDAKKAGKSQWDLWTEGWDSGALGQVVGGAVDGLNELATSVEEMVNNANAFQTTWPLAIQLHNIGFNNPEIWKKMGLEGNIFETLQYTARLGLEADKKTGRQLDIPELPTTDRVEGFWPEAIRATSQFVTGQAAINTLLGPGAGSMTKLGMAGRGLGEGALTAAFAFDPDEGNLADVFKMMGVELDVVDFLSTTDKEEEDRFTKRLKNGMIDAGFGLGIHGILAGLKRIKTSVMNLTEGTLKPLSQKSRLQDPEATALAKPKTDQPDPEVIGETVEDSVSRTAQQMDEVPPTSLIRVDEDAFDSFMKAQDSPAVQVSSVPGGELPIQTGREAAQQARRHGGISVNWKYVDTEGGIQQVFNEMSITIKGHLDKSMKGKGWADDETIAKRMNLLPEQLQQLPGTLERARHEILAGRILQVNALERLVELVNIYKTPLVGNPLKGSNWKSAGKASQLDDLLRHYSVTAAMTEWLAGATSEAGRLLNSLKIPVKSDAAGLAKLETFIDSYGGAAGIDALVSLVKRIEMDRKHGPTGRWVDILTGAMRNLGRGLTWTKELIVDNAVQGMISSTVTLGRNLAGNTYMIADKIVRTQIEGMIPWSPTKMGEATKMTAAAFKYLPDAVLRSTVAMITDKPQTKLFRNEFYKSSLEGNLHNNVDTLIGDGLRFINKSIYLPGRLNMAQDEFFRSINIGMEKDRLAHRYAVEAEADGVLPYQQAYNDLQSKNPKSPMRHHYKEMDKRMMNEAASQIFATPVGTKESWFGWGGHQLLEQLNWLRHEPTGVAKLFMPFYGTIVNLDRTALERLPLANLIVKESVTSLFGRRGREAQATAMGKLFVGTSIAMGAWRMMDEGNMTGSYPPELDPDMNPADYPYYVPSRKYLQDSSWKPYALVSEEGYRSMRGLDPVALMTQLGADAWIMNKIYEQAGGWDGIWRTDQEKIDGVNSFNEMWKYTSLAAMTKIEERPFMKGISDIRALVDDDDLRNKSAQVNLLSQINPVQSYYAALRAAYARSKDAYQRDSKAHDVIDQNWLNFRRRNNWLFDITGQGGSTGLNPRVNFVGDPQLIYAVSHWFDDPAVSRAAQAFLNLASVSPVDKSPIMERIREIGGVKTEFPSRWVAIQIPGEGKKFRESLNQEQQYAWVMEAAKLNRKVFTKEYVESLATKPTGTQRKIIELILNKNKIAAMQTMLWTNKSWKPIAEEYPQLLVDQAKGILSDKKTAPYYNLAPKRQRAKKKKTAYEWMKK